jgi:peptide chain release factor 3
VKRREPLSTSLENALAAEYGLDAGFESIPFETCRCVTAKDPAELGTFIRAHPSSMAADLVGAPVFIATSARDFGYEQDKWPEVSSSDVKDYRKAAE